MRKEEQQERVVSWKSKKENVSRKREGSVVLMWSNNMTTKNWLLLKRHASYLVARLEQVQERRTGEDLEPMGRNSSFAE